jgi:hypothetical protein
MRGPGDAFFADADAAGAAGSTVEELIAPIAGIFHWSPETCFAFDLVELLEWRNHAVTFWNDINRVEKT